MKHPIMLSELETKDKQSTTGEKIAWWAIAIMIFYLIFIDK